MELCPVCFWEDAPGSSCWNGSNQVSLLEAQRNFIEFGACEREHLDSVRSSLPEENRPDEWATFDEIACRIVAMIDEAFADVKLGNGLTIQQREAIDGYQSAEEIEAARKRDPETRWQDIAREKIGCYGTTLVFLDPESIRFHLPAFMRYGMWCWQKEENFSRADMVLYSLDGGPNSTGYFSDAFEILNDSQKQTVAAFLKFVSLVDDIYGGDAEKGLDNGWAQWLPDILSFPAPL